MSVINKARPGRGSTETTCKTCGVPMIVETYELSRGGGKFCSTSCSAKYGTVVNSQKGPGNHNWKGGVSKDNMRYRKRQKEKWPEKEKCRQATRSAIRSGSLVKEPCDVCGITEDIHAHHEDYKKPLEVTWLCRSHHRERHL